MPRAMFTWIHLTFYWYGRFSRALICVRCAPAFAVTLHHMPRDRRTAQPPNKIYPIRTYSGKSEPIARLHGMYRGDWRGRTTSIHPNLTARPHTHAASATHRPLYPLLSACAWHTQVYFFGPSTCQIVSSVAECGSSLTRKVEQEWAINSACNGVFDAPTHEDIPCGEDNRSPSPPLSGSRLSYLRYVYWPSDRAPGERISKLTKSKVQVKFTGLALLRWLCMFRRCCFLIFGDGQVLSAVLDVCE